ncbi:MAG: EamA family transporter RarD [Rhodobacteraceae bacterium]|jgi:chloramphenicol-sensitive protein RarD|nr:EamA family transporter RarD [Paracoccaceae bacterium]
MSPSISVEKNNDTSMGLFYGASAYFLWGVLPLYMKAMSHIPTLEIIGHRIIWSLPIVGIIIILRGNMRNVFAALKDPRQVLTSILTAFLLSINWGLYVWAITSGHALDAALGYFINPLFSIFLGAVFLREKLNRVQWVAIIFVAFAVGLLTWDYGHPPYISLGMTFSWGIYGFLKKSLPIGPNQGFFLEILLLAPMAIAYIIYLEIVGGYFGGGSSTDVFLLLGCGVVTAGPLLLFANGAKLLRLSTIGILQYLAPTMMFLIAIFIFKEQFGTIKFISFSIIWLSLIIYSFGIFFDNKS